MLYICGMFEYRTEFAQSNRCASLGTIEFYTLYIFMQSSVHETLQTFYLKDMILSLYCIIILLESLLY